MTAKTQTEKLLLVVEPKSTEEATKADPFKFFLIAPQHKFFLSDDKQIAVKEIEIEYLIPERIGDDELALAAIKQLQERQNKIRAEAFERCERIEQQIQDLLLLTHQPE